MLRKIRRQFERLTTTARQKPAGNQLKKALHLENLESRLLLDTAGWWDELGWRSATGGGVSWDQTSEAAEAELVMSSDGDPVVFWVEGPLNEFVGGNDGSGRMAFHTEAEGPIYARQFMSESDGWWDFTSGSGDAVSIGNGKELDAASGPNGEMALAYVSNDAINVTLWSGNGWTALGSPISDSVFSGTIHAEKPSIAISDTGEIFVSYTAVHPLTNQRDIVVKKYAYEYSNNDSNPPQNTDLTWVELVNEDVGNFAETATQLTGGVSNDQANSYDSAIAIDHTGKPIVTWVNLAGEGQSDIYAKRWDGDSWEEIGDGSASDIDGDGVSGVSEDETVSMQPDIAVANNGDIIIAWANWSNWAEYNTNGQGGVYVKVLHENSQVWEEYADGSATGAGIAAPDDYLAGQNPDALGLGWYYSPKITVDSSNHPFITWQGYGSGERFTANRVETDTTQGLESPLMGIYASHYEDAAFRLLYDPLNLVDADTQAVAQNMDGLPRGTVNEASTLAWMPAVLVNNQDELVMAYTWRDSVSDSFHQDDELYVVEWNDAASTWDAMGRGADSNGNDVFGNYPLNDFSITDSSKIQLGLIDYDNDSSTEPDLLVAVPSPDVLTVNGGKIYRYSRTTGLWTDDVELAGGFGQTFDLRGEPEYENDVDGQPLLAYLDDVTGLPFVYQWAGGNWSLVGDPDVNGGAAGEAGVLDVGKENISVQAGPNGKVLLAYAVTSGSNTRIRTRLWDPNSVSGQWEDVGGGTLALSGAKQAVYYATYEGFDWDVNGDLSDGSYDDAGNRDYGDTMGSWFYWGSDDGAGSGTFDTFADLDMIGASVSDTAGEQVASWVDIDGSPRQAGVEFTVTVPQVTTTDGSDDPATIADDPVGTQIGGEVDHQLRMASDGYAIIKVSYAMNMPLLPGADANDPADDEPGNIDLDLYLEINGSVVDANIYDDIEFTPIASVEPGNNIDYTRVTLDTKELGVILPMGVNTVGFRVFATVNDNGLPATAAEQVGTVWLDNVAVYQRVVPEGREPANDFNENPIDAGTWSFTSADDPKVLGAWSPAAGRRSDLDSLPDGALVMTLGDGVGADSDLSGQFEYTFTPTVDGNAVISFDYRMQTGSAIADGATLDLTVTLDGNTQTVQELVGGGEDSDWLHTELDWYDLFHDTLLNGVAQTVVIEASLSASSSGNDGTARVAIDNVLVKNDYSFTFDTGVAGWTFEAVSGAVAGGDGTLATDNGQQGAGDGVLEMTFSDSGAGGEEGRWKTDFTVPDGGRNVTLDLDYFLSINDANLAADDTLDLRISYYDGTTRTNVNSLGKYRLTSDGAVEDSGWVSLSGISLGTLDAGTYTLELAGVISDNDTAAGGEITVRLDNVQINLNAGSGTWEHTPSGGDTGGNGFIGPVDANGIALFDDNNGTGFRADIHSQTFGLADYNYQSYVIEDVVQSAEGDMVISFRYLLDDGTSARDGYDADVRVLVDGVEYDSEDPSGHAFPLNIGRNWWNRDDDDPQYTWVRVLAENISEGTHTVTIELVGSDVAADFYLDNVTILASQPTDAMRPQARLASTGSGTRAFVVGVINNSPDIWVYPTESQVSDTDLDIWPYGPIMNHDSIDPRYLVDGYSTSSIFELQDDAWERYGDDLQFTRGINFLGVGTSESSANLDMPRSEVAIMEDMVVGPGQVEWIAFQRAETDWVDSDADDVKETFQIHWVIPSNPETYWNVTYTVLEANVWRWLPTPGDPSQVDPNWQPHWDSTGFAPTVTEHAYTHMQMISSAGQNPTVAWTRRDSGGLILDAGALRYEGGNDVWGILGPSESVQNVTTGPTWDGSNGVMDMIVTPDGDPIIAYEMMHMNNFAVREFRRDIEQPVQVVTENSGTPNDDILEFGTVTSDYVEQLLTISNEGQGELVIYDIMLGGYGDLANNPFSLTAPPEGFPGVPVRLAPAGEEGDSIDFVVRFDPTDVPAGEYDAVLVIYSNDIQSSSHPFAHYYELNMTATVASNKDLQYDSDRQWLRFDDTIVFPVYDPDDPTTWNGGGVSDVIGKFREDFTLSEAGDVTLSFDYRLKLGERLTEGQTLDLIVNLDGSDIVQSGEIRIVGDASDPNGSWDSGYQSLNITLSNLSQGVHTLLVEGELSESKGGVGGTGQIYLDNVQIDDVLTEDFNLDPGQGHWTFITDTGNPDGASQGDWSRDVGTDATGGLEMILGFPLEIEQFVLENVGETPMTVRGWVFDNSIFRLLNEDRDNIAGAYHNHLQQGGAFVAEEIDSTNLLISDGGLEMVLGDRRNAITDLSADFSYPFTLSSAVTGQTVSFAYQLLTGADLADGQTLTLNVVLEKVDGSTTTVIYEGQVNQLSGSGQNSGYTDVSGLNLGDLSAGDYKLLFQAVLSESAAAADGVGKFRLDNVALSGVIDMDKFDRDELGIKWQFDADEQNPDASSGYFNASGGRYGNGDDVILSPGDNLTLQVIFEPLEGITYDNTLYIFTDVQGEELIPVRLTGTGVGGANITVEYNNEMIPDNSTIPLPLPEDRGVIDIGSVVRGSSKTVTVTLGNDGSTDLTVVSVEEISDTRNLIISPIVNNQVIAPGDTFDITLTYAPTAGVGIEAENILELNTTLLITNDDPDLQDRLYHVDVVGLGVPEIPLVEMIDPDTGRELENGRLDFGTTFVGQSVEKTVQIANPGGADLVLEGFVWDDPQFSITPENQRNVGDNQAGTDDITLAMDESVTLTVTFTPTHAGTVTDSFTVYYFDEDGNVTFTTTGNSYPSVIQFVANVVGRQISVTDTQGDAGDSLIDFGTVGTNVSAGPYTITMSNVGSSNLTISGWDLTDPFGVFTLDAFSGSDVVLSPGQSQSINVSFVPDQPDQVFDGTQTYVTITSDDPTNPTWTVELVGASAQPGELATDKTELDFGSVVVGQEKSEDFIISNSGSDKLLVTEIVLPGRYFSWSSPELENTYDSTLGGYVIEPGEQFEISVIFTPVDPFNSSTSTIPPVLEITTDNLSGAEPEQTSLALRGESIFATEISNGKLIWLDSDGRPDAKIIIRRGTATITPVSSSDNTIASIALSQTSSKSVLKVIGLQEDTRLGQVTGGLMKQVVLKNTVLDGDINTNGVDDDSEGLIVGEAIDLQYLSKKLTLANVTNGADINIGEVLGKGITIITGQMAGDGNPVDITVGGQLKKLKAQSYQDGSVTADSIKQIKVMQDDFHTDINVADDFRLFRLKGQRTQPVDGKFVVGGTLKTFVIDEQTFSGDIQAGSIGKIRLDDMNQAAITSRGAVDKLLVKGDVDQSLVLAGYDVGDDQQLGGGDDSIVSGGSINKVSVAQDVRDTFMLSGILPAGVGGFDPDSFNIEAFDVFQTTPADTRSGIIGKIQFGTVSNSSLTYGVAGTDILDGVFVGHINVTDGSPWDFFKVERF